MFHDSFSFWSMWWDNDAELCAKLILRELNKKCDPTRTQPKIEKIHVQNNRALYKKGFTNLWQRGPPFMIKIKHYGSWKRTEKFLKSADKKDFRRILESYGQEGVRALSSATPIDSGLTANSWDYEVVITNRGYTLSWVNTNVINGVQIAIILQYGHGTGSGGYVQGRDYINPAIRPVFDQIAEKLWEEVTKL